MAEKEKKAAQPTAPKAIDPDAGIAESGASVDPPDTAALLRDGGEKDAQITTENILNADAKHALLYQGASGQMAVMSEFLYRLINVAVPEVDVGDDIFVVREKDEAVTRVQVKYGRAVVQQNDSYVAQFSLPWKQFDRPDDVDADLLQEANVGFKLVIGCASRKADRINHDIILPTQRFLLRQRIRSTIIQFDGDVGSVIVATKH
jgi:hypothetical protein